MAKYLYEHIGNVIRRQIRNHTLMPGDRLPSIRRMSRQMKVSVGTVQQAYAGLEDQDMIVPRQGAGYYVKARADVPPPEAAAFTPVPSEVSVLDTAVRVMQTAARKDLLQLGSAVPDVSGPGVRRLHDEFRRQAGNIPNYDEHPSGYFRLRQRLARRLMDSGCAVDPEEIIITAGCQEALTLALRCIAGPGDTILVESPCYYGALQALECLGLRALEIPVSPETGPDLDELAAILAAWPVKGMLINPAFSNPTGYLCPKEKKARLLECLAVHDIPLIEDDVFAWLGYGETRPGSIYSHDRDGRVMLCGSISKVLSSDLRIGWLVGGRYARKARNLKFISTICNPIHAQFALAGFLTTRQLDRHLRSVTRGYMKKQQAMVHAIRRWFPEETRVTRPEGGFLAWVKLPETVDSMALHRQALESGITIAPGGIFSPTGRYRNYIRLNYAVASRDEMNSAVKTLAGLLTRIRPDREGPG